MLLFHRNRPNHSLLLMPVRLENKRLPKNKVRILSCDAEGRLFIQLVGRSIYQRIRKESQQMEISQNNYATIYWDTGKSRPTPLLVKIGNEEAWALEHILEHALRHAIVPEILTRYIKEIIKLGKGKRQEQLLEKTEETRKAISPTSPRVLDRLPYYRKQDIEVSIPIYKEEYAFPLIILKRLPQAKNAPVNQQRLLVLDSDGDMAVTTLPSEQINKAKRRLNNLHTKGKEGHLICSRKPEGVSVDVMEISELQRQALENLTHYFEEIGLGKEPISDAVKQVLNKARETVLS
jgi:hypothetical protein